MKNQDANNISGSATVNQAQGDIHIYQGMSEEQVRNYCDNYLKQYISNKEDRKIAEETACQLITALQDKLNETEKKFQALQDEIKEKDEINQAFKDEVNKIIQDFMNESRDKMNESRDKMNESRDNLSKLVSHTRKEEPNKEEVQQETSNIAKEANKGEVLRELTNIVKETNIEDVQQNPFSFIKKNNKYPLDQNNKEMMYKGLDSLITTLAISVMLPINVRTILYDYIKRNKNKPLDD